MSKDITWTRSSVIDLINESNLATGKALWGLYQRQTASEQSAETTTDRNGVGFNGRDAAFLSSVASRLPKYGYTLSPRQLPHVRHKIKKYVRQLLEIIEEKGGKVDYTAEKPAPNQIIAAPVTQTTPPVEDRAQFGLF